MVLGEIIMMGQPMKELARKYIDGKLSIVDHAKVNEMLAGGAGGRLAAALSDEVERLENMPLQGGVGVIAPTPVRSKQGGEVAAVTCWEASSRGELGVTDARPQAR